MILPGDAPKVGWWHQCLICGHIWVAEQQEATCRQCGSIYLSKMPVLLKEKKT